jgi:hypothetical protein
MGCERMVDLSDDTQRHSSTNDRKISPLKFFPGPAGLARSRSYRRAVKRREQRATRVKPVRTPVDLARSLGFLT